MTAVFHYLLFIWLCCPFILHLVELSSQLLTTDKAHSSESSKNKSSKGIWAAEGCILMESHWTIYFLVCFIWKSSFVYFAQIPELHFSFMIQRSLKLIIPLINVSFESHPACLKVELTILFDIWNGGMLTWMFLIFPWKLFQFCVFLHNKNGRTWDYEMNVL